MGKPLDPVQLKKSIVKKGLRVPDSWEKKYVGKPPGPVPLKKKHYERMHPGPLLLRREICENAAGSFIIEEKQYEQNLQVPYCWVGTALSTGWA